MKLLTVSLLFFASLRISAQDGDEKMIRDMLHTQTLAWNKGNIEEFMHGYWNNDSLMFIGKSGVTYGYANTLNNYKKGYPDTAAMGQLKFDILLVQRLSDEYYSVVGKWALQRSKGDVNGHYTLLFRKIKGQWVIISDHSS